MQKTSTQQQQKNARKNSADRSGCKALREVTVVSSNLYVCFSFFMFYSATYTSHFFSPQAL
jgi:hypothetical protein